MGPINSDLSKVAIQITDSPYVVVSTRIMARMGKKILDILGEDGFFIPCIHSVGMPLINKDGIRIDDVPWPCNIKRICIAHFPETYSIWSYGSGYGGNALLGKKCLALRIASVMARDEMWLAEHMLIIGVEDKYNNKTYITGAFPSQCGKTNFSMMIPPIELQQDMKITTLGDDIAWLKPNKDGYLYAINPENGFFGVAPGTSLKTNEIAIKTCNRDTIFTNVALTDDGDVWWEGLSDPPKHLIDWQGNDWTPNCGRLAAHSNSRFTTPLINCPILDKNWDNPKGVPISGILYGGRRESDIPLVYQTFNWTHGVYTGATILSETTSANQDSKVGILRSDPFAMLPFCGYNMADYFKHYLSMGHIIKYKPCIFHVNFFRRDLKTKKFLYPGFSQNARILKWIIQRINGQINGIETSIGIVPRYIDIDWKGINYTVEDFEKLMSLDGEPIKFSTTMDHDKLILTLSSKMPYELICER